MLCSADASLRNRASAIVLSARSVRITLMATTSPVSIGVAAVDFSHAARRDVRLDLKYAVQPRAGGQALLDSIWGIHVGHVGLSPGGAAPRAGYGTGRANHHCRHIVGRAALEGQVDQRIAGPLRRVAVASARISRSSTWLVSPSLQSTKTSPGSSAPLVISSSGSS